MTSSCACIINRTLTCACGRPSHHMYGAACAGVVIFIENVVKQIVFTFHIDSQVSGQFFIHFINMLLKPVDVLFVSVNAIFRMFILCGVMMCVDHKFILQDCLRCSSFFINAIQAVICVVSNLQCILSPFPECCHRNL